MLRPESRPPSQRNQAASLFYPKESVKSRKLFRLGVWCPSGDWISGESVPRRKQIGPSVQGRHCLAVESAQECPVGLARPLKWGTILELAAPRPKHPAPSVGHAVASYPSVLLCPQDLPSQKARHHPMLQTNVQGSFSLFGRVAPRTRQPESAADLAEETGVSHLGQSRWQIGFLLPKTRG
jgi:hypothetical protein